jgi:NAD(P)-dependent dehydrogenase (short-subunit alcohol dehydrogenase family)
LLDAKIVTVNALSPGVVATNLISDFKSLPRFLAFLNKFKYDSPEKGAETSIYLASSDEVNNISGKYFVNKKIDEASITSRNENIANQLWDESKKMCGISEFIY